MQECQQHKDKLCIFALSRALQHTSLSQQQQPQRVVAALQNGGWMLPCLSSRKQRQRRPRRMLHTHAAHPLYTFLGSVIVSRSVQRGYGTRRVRHKPPETALSFPPSVSKVIQGIVLSS